jgi:hypothetical protein
MLASPALATAVIIAKPIENAVRMAFVRVILAYGHFIPHASGNNATDRGINQRELT